MLADVICYWKLHHSWRKMVFLCLKDVTKTRKRMQRSLSIGKSSFSAMAKSWKNLKTSNVFSSFIVW